MCLSFIAESSMLQNSAILSDECTLLCSFAMSKLEQMWELIREAKIRVFELEKVSKHVQHMENLCCAVAAGSADPRRKLLWSLETVRPILQQRIQELSAVHTYRDRLKYLCTILPKTAGIPVALFVPLYFNEFIV